MTLYIKALHTGSGAGNDVKLPTFLTRDGGVNSGFMIAHCTSAALGEYKVHFSCLLLFNNININPILMSFPLRL